MFTEQGAPVLSADESARAVVRPGSTALEHIQKIFGPGVLSKNGELSRRALRDIVFSDASARRELEAIMHPAIREHLDRQIKTVRAPYVIIEIPLLVESGHGVATDRVLVVTAPPNQRVERVMKRDKTDRDSVHAIIDSQATDQQRAAQADDFIANDGSLDALAGKVKKLDRFYRQLAESGNATG